MDPPSPKKQKNRIKLQIPTATTTNPATEVVPELPTESYTPYAAMMDGQPARLFNHTQCKLAKQWARSQHLAMFAVEISDSSRAMNYVVGTWRAAADMVMHQNLAGYRESLLSGNLTAMTAVYECVFNDQRTWPYFDLEFYADAKHGNAQKFEQSKMDNMTRTVARSASALLAELFPDQIAMVNRSRRPLAPAAKCHAGWPCRVLKARHYVRPAGLKAGHQPRQLDPEVHWTVLDASLNAKRSQHLILSPAFGVCWDTIVDQAIFVGLLVRRLYKAAFAIYDDDPEGGDAKDCFANAEFQAKARTLFVGDLYADTEPIWTSLVDTVVYKRFQLIRTAYSSKRNQDRPLKPHPHMFALAKLDKYEVLRSTLLGRMALHGGPDRLSFSRAYPSMFGLMTADEIATTTTPSSHLPLGSWRWVPNYKGRGADTPPKMVKKPGEANQPPWAIKRHRDEVRVWLARVDPTRTADLPSSLPTSVLRARRTKNKRQRMAAGAAGWTDVSYAMASDSMAAAQVIAKYIFNSSQLKPWACQVMSQAQLAGSLHNHVSKRLNTWNNEMEYSALIDPGLVRPNAWCLISSTNHGDGRPYLLIDSQRGKVRLKCLAGKCNRLSVQLNKVMLPEDLRLLFPMAFQRPSSSSSSSLGTKRLKTTS